MVLGSDIRKDMPTVLSIPGQRLITANRSRRIGGAGEQRTGPNRKSSGK